MYIYIYIDRERDICMYVYKAGAGLRRPKPTKPRAQFRSLSREGHLLSLLLLSWIGCPARLQVHHFIEIAWQ